MNSAWLETAFAKHGWIAIGLTFGLAAKYALLIKRGIAIKPQLLAADILLLPMVALIAYNLSITFGAEAEKAALLTAAATVGADRLVKLYTERFFRTVETEAEAAARRIRGEVRQEVQAEISGREIAGDFLSGHAPAEYEALKRPAATTPPTKKDD